MTYIIHNLSKHPLYRAYRNMIYRCYDKNNVAYDIYGGRGVVVCEEWRNDFLKFYNWALLNGWHRDLRIDKDIIPKKLGIPALLYSPEMCSIVSKKENANAVSNNIEMEYMGRKQNLSQWAEELGFDYRHLWSRLRMGWSHEKTLSTPKKSINELNLNRRKIILNTETGIFYFGAKEAADSIGISVPYMNHKLLGKQPKDRRFIYAQ